MLVIHLLGQFTVGKDGNLLDIASKPARILLAYLVLNSGVWRSRTTVAGTLWPDSTPARGRSSLRNALSTLQTVIGKTYISRRNDKLLFSVDHDIWIDILALETRADAYSSIDDLIDCVGLYRGPLLPDFEQDWVVIERTRLENIFKDRMRDLTDNLLLEHRWAEAIDQAETWIKMAAGLPEHAYRTLIVAYSGLGEQSSVSATYQRCMKELGKIGEIPTVDTRELYGEVVNGEFPDTYFEKLRNIRISPLPLEQISSLPIFSTAFIGREDALADLHRRLSDPSCRLLTLIGLGGIGKTRLALHFASNMSISFRDGIYFVPLSAVDHPENLASTIAEATGMLASDVQPIEQQLIDHLAAKKTLIILDNMEHLQAAATYIARLIQEAPSVKLLVTSREPLQLQDEIPYVLHGLSVPTSTTFEGSLDYSAVALFIDRAQRTNPDFQPDPENIVSISEICQIMDGLPLGIELAAARTRSATPQRIIAQIRENMDIMESTIIDVPDRQRSLRAVFEYSWAQLTPVEQLVLARCTIISGPFTNELARSITDAPFDVLDSLTGQALLIWQDDVYRLHPLIRWYAHTKLEELPDDFMAVHLKLWEYFSSLITDFTTDLRGGDVASAADLIAVHLDNIRAGIQWAVSDPTTDISDEVLINLWLTFSIRGTILEGFGLFRELLNALDDTPTNSLLRWKLATLQTDLADESQSDSNLSTVVSGLNEHRDSDSDSIFYLLAIGLASHTLGADQISALLDKEKIRATRDPWEKAIKLYLASHSYLYIAHQAEKAETLLQESQQLYHMIGDDYWLMRVYLTRGDIAFKIGEYNQADILISHGLDLATRLGNPGMLAWASVMKARVLAELGHFDEAQHIHDNFLADYRSLRTPFMRSSARYAAAQLATLQGEFQIAVEQLRSTLQKPDQVGSIEHINYLVTLAHLHVAEHNYGQAEETLTQAYQYAQQRKYQIALHQIYNLKSRIARHFGLSGEEFENLLGALKMSYKSGYAPEVLNTIETIAEYMRNEGHLDRAFVLATFVEDHPSSSIVSQQKADGLILDIEKTWPGGSIPDGLEVMSDRTLDEVIQELLSELSD